MPAILLADDNPATRSALILLLTTRLGCTDIHTAGDWQALKETGIREQPALILLDWELPGFSPQTGLAELREIVSGAALIALSTLPEAAQAARQAGAQAFIGKSHPPDQVLRIIRAALNLD